jgi:hypothetical protein
MSQYGKLILIIGVVVACAVGAILPFAFAGSAERDEDANALRDVGRLIQTQGVVSNYSIAVWTDSLDMTLATSDTSEAAIVAYQVCSEHKYRYATSGSFGFIWAMAIKSLNAKLSADDVTASRPYARANLRGLRPKCNSIGSWSCKGRALSLPSPACSMSSFLRVRHRTQFIHAASPMRRTVCVAWGVTEAVLNAD